MLRTILQYFSVIFPQTFARLAHWYNFLVYGDTDLFDLIISILPTCIYFIVDVYLGRNVRIDDDAEELPENRPGSFRTINHCMKFWFFVYKAFDLLVALDLVLRASGFFRKLLLAMDLVMECTMVLVAKTLFMISISVFVGAAFEGFPYIEDFFTVVWMCLQDLILAFRELREDFGRIEVPAEHRL